MNFRSGARRLDGSRYVARPLCLGTGTVVRYLVAAGGHQ